jgi:predicted outer membrane lipoprotein
MSKPASLSLDQAPPIGVPLRFFLTAPLFALTAALLLLWQGPDVFSSRWNPALLGLTHLLTLGFIGLTMLGAVLQMLPVVAGAPVRRPVLIATFVHALGTGGIVLLCYGLIFTAPLALQIALPTLGTAFLLFSVLIVITLRRAPPKNMTARAMRLAAMMLAATVLLGLVLLSNHAFGWWLQTREMVVDLHLTWGLLGWIGILVVGVAYQVVPMFQLTPPYPATLTRWLTLLLFILLLGLAPASYFPALRMLLGILLAAGFAAFVLSTLWLQSQRRRKLPDVTLNFWRGGMISLLLAIALWLMAQIVPALGVTQSYGLLLGMLMIVGFAMSVINGMLYKIVPFLVWFHLQSRRGANGPKVPNVRELLPESRTRRQMWLHFAALGTLLAAVLSPAIFTYPAALLFGTSNLWLWLNMVSASRTYRKVNALLGQTTPGAGESLVSGFS